MKILVRISMALVAMAAFALSFQSLMTLGELAGYGALAWMYPVVVDLGTVSSCAAWMATRSRQAFHMTWTLLAISVLQNGTVHWLLATHRAPAWWLVTLVATVPPIVLGLTVHLAVGLGGPGQLSEVAGTGDPGQRGQVEREQHGTNLSPAHQPASGDGGQSESGAPGDGPGAAGDPAGEDRAAALIAEGAGRRRLAVELGISEHSARRMLAERDGRENGALR